MTVANLVVPNTINEDLSRPSGFPNGRRLTDPVIDLTLGFLFIDIGKHGVDAQAKIPLNPAGNDQPFRAAFPYLAPPQGNPPGLTPGGTTFSFRSDPVSSYVKVDRMGMPAVATAVIGSSAKTGYNDDSPGVDGTRKYVPEIQNTLTALTSALADAFARLRPDRVRQRGLDGSIAALARSSGTGCGSGTTPSVPPSRDGRHWRPWATCLS